MSLMIRAGGYSLILALAGAPRPSDAAQSHPAGGAAARDISNLLRPILEKHNIPGMAAVCVSGDGTILSRGAAGVRARGDETKITIDDRFHLGSCTKSMTATLCAMLVEEKILSWNATCGEVFKDLVPAMDAAWKPVTLEQLLTNRSGAPGDLNAGGLWGQLWQHKGTPREAREKLVIGVLTHPPEAQPGSKFIYSNGGFSIAGAMAERVTDTPWETLITKRLFTPLGMASAGFGTPGIQESLDQPRGHHDNGTPVPPGPGSDNPAAIGPAGIVHCSIGDWAKYISLHLRGERADTPLLHKHSFIKLHEPAKGKDNFYAMGWAVAERPWGGGRVLNHNGSNTMWFCVAWLAPNRDFAVLVTCNQGGTEADRACDDAASALIQEHESSAASRPAKPR